MPDQQQLAERLLSTLTARDRAANIVGDLAETAAARGGRGFWRSVAATALGLAWRPLVLILGCILVQVIFGATFALSMNTHQHRSTNAWPLLPAAILGFSAMLLSAVALFNGVRHGLRDRIAQLAIALSVVGWLGGTLHFVSPVLLISSIAFLALLIYSAASRKFRGALVAVVLTLVGSWIVFFTWVMFFSMLMLNVRGAEGLRSPGWFPFNYMLLIAVELYIPSRVRRYVA